MRSLPLLVAVLLISACTGDTNDPTLSSPTTSLATDGFDSVRSAAFQLINEQQQCAWYLTGNMPNSESEMGFVLSAIETADTQATTCWQNARGSSRAVDSLVQAIEPMIGYGFVQPDGSMISSSFDKGMYFALYGQAMQGSPVLPQGATITYSIANSTIYTPAYITSSDWFCAQLLHESLHAKRHLIDSDTQASMSDRWVKEEVDAHKLERDVLVHLTDGEYLSVLEMVLAQHTDSETVTELVQSLNYYDLEVLNSTFDPGCQGEVGQRVAQFILDLGDLWLISQGSTDMGDRIELYRTLFKALAS